MRRDPRTDDRVGCRAPGRREQPGPDPRARDPRARAAAEARALLRDGLRNPIAEPAGPVTAPALGLLGAPNAAESPDPAGAIEVVDEAAQPQVTVPAGAEDAGAEDAGAYRLPPASPSAPGRARRSRRATVALGVTCVALAAGLVAALVGLRAESATAGRELAIQRAGSEAVAAARAYAVDLSSYSYKDLNTSADKVLANATASFRKSYTASSSALDAVLEHYQASAVGRVLAAGVETASPGQVVVLVFLDQTATNSEHTKPTTDESRLEMTLVERHHRWLIDKVLVL
jgi:Mce-associated membrane protein